MMTLAPAVLADPQAAGLGMFLGTGAALFVALMWLRLFRWIFALFGLKA